MSESNNEDFEVSIRVLGNEMLALKMATTKTSNKWMFASIITLGLLIWSISIFGPSIIAFTQGMGV
jgi:hypothetical protein|tara:strand:+ start:265 stop:462 length:198 start_codon:yes stop_codon:yes gene_type:complete